MQGSWLLGSQGHWHCRVCRRASGHAHRSYGITRDFFLSLWQLTFERPPWLVLLCCLVQKALKGPHSLRSFSVGKLPAYACGDREATMMTPPPVHDSAILPCLHGGPTFLQRLSLQQSPPSHPLGPSPHNSTAVLNLGLLSIPMLQCPGSMCPRECPCLGHVERQHRLSVWFSLHSDCHRSVASLSNSPKCLSSVPNNCPHVGISPLLQFLHPPWVQV